MTTSGLINFMDNPIINHRARINGKKYERNFIKILKVNHTIVNKDLNKDIFKLNVPTSEIHQTMSVIFSINNRPLKYLINNPDDGMIKIVLKTSDYFMLEDLQYLLIKNELTITTDLKLKETLITTKWKDEMIVRCITSTENHPNIKII